MAEHTYSDKSRITIHQETTKRSIHQEFTGDQLSEAVLALLDMLTEEERRDLIARINEQYGGGT